MSTYAAIDIGTNAVLLLIADIIANTIYPLHVETRIARLGQSTQSTRQLHPDAMRRVITILQEYQHLIEAHQVKKTVVVSTSAARDAENRQDFIDRVWEATGWSLEIISGEEEARLTFSGGIAGLPFTHSELILVDIGGGSTEFVRGTSGGNILQATSLNIGSVRLLDQFITSAPTSEAEYQALTAFLDSQIRSVNITAHQARLIGVAGTVTTIAAILQGLTSAEAGGFHGMTMTLEDVRYVSTKLRAMTLSERLQLPDVLPGREDAIVVGSAILERAMIMLQADSILVSEGGLRYGVLRDRCCNCGVN